MIYGFGIFTGVGEGSNVGIRRLHFPPAYPPTTASRYESSTAIRQFSAGRAHVLGLADNGSVWHWQRYTATRVQLSAVGILEANVTRVVAGELQNHFAA